MSRRRLRAALVVTGAAVALLGAMPGTALAAGATPPTISVDSPVTGTEQISVTVDQGGGAFTITGPGSYSYGQNIAASADGSTASCSFNPRSSGCSNASAILPNGSYTISATSSGYQKCGAAGLNCTNYSATSSSKTFLVSAPPARPTGVDAVLTAAREVQVRWDPNQEPDVTGYDLVDADGGLLVADLRCDGSDCHVALTYPDDDPGGTKQYAVRAHRLDGSGGDLESSPSATASATLPPPSSGDSGSGGDDGSGGSTGDGGSTGGGGGSSGGGSSGGGSSGGGTQGGGGVVDDGGSGSPSTGGGGSGGGGPTYSGYSGRPGLPFSFTSSGGGLRMPNLPGGGGGNLKPQIPEGTYDPTLGYQPQVDVETVRDRTLSTRFVTTIGSAFTDTKRLLRSLAVALILIMLGMHVRRWSRTSSYE